MKNSFLLYRMYTIIADYIQINNDNIYIVLFIFIFVITITLYILSSFCQYLIIQLLKLYHGYKWTTSHINSYYLVEKQCIIRLISFKPLTIRQENLFTNFQ